MPVFVMVPFSMVLSIPWPFRVIDLFMINASLYVPFGTLIMLPGAELFMASCMVENSGTVRIGGGLTEMEAATVMAERFRMSAKARIAQVNAVLVFKFAQED